MTIYALFIIRGVFYFFTTEKPKRVFFDGAAIKKLGLGFLGVNNMVY